MSCCLAPTKPSPKSIIMWFNWNARIKWDFAEMFISMLVFLEMLVHKVPCTDLAHNERKKNHAQTQVTIANAMLSIKQPFDIYNCTNLQTKSIIAIRAQFNWVAYDMDMNLSDLENLRLYWRTFFSEFSLSLSFYTFAMHENIQHERKSHTILIVKQRLRLIYLGNLGAHWVHSACKPGVIFVTEIIFFSFSIKVIK